ATSPRTNSCTDPSGARSAKEISESRAILLMTSLQRGARSLVSADVPDSTSAVSVEGGIFISARTERIAVTRSTTQPISASAAGSANSAVSTTGKANAGIGSKGLAAAINATCSTDNSLALRDHGARANSPSRLAVTAQSSSVMKGMNG